MIEAQLQRTRDRLRAALSSMQASEVAASDHESPEPVDVEIAADVFPVSWMRERLALSETEACVLWVLIAHELCPTARKLNRALNTEPLFEPTIDAIRRAVYGPGSGLAGWHELGAQGTLRRLGIIERSDTLAETPEHRQTLKASRRLLALVYGDDGLDTELLKISRIDDGVSSIDDLELGPTTVEVVDAGFDAEPGLLVVTGRKGTGRRSLLSALAHRRDQRVLLIDARAIAKERDHAQQQLRTIARECALFELLPLFMDLDALAEGDATPDRLDLIESELAGLVLATATAYPARRWKRPPLVVELPALRGEQRATLWSRALPDATVADAELLATMYPLAPALIFAAGKVATRACGDAEMQPHHIETGIRAVLDDRLAGLATRITTTQSWSDLILPEDQTTAVIELLARIRRRGRVYEDWGFAQKVGKGLGISALFSGPPGTGKTMCAGLIARDLGTELYQVDLSKMVSKWIGDTEKNLAALFDAAEAGHAILLFDEADALFGKRTTVTSSNDRHANQQVNYLLQRMETFSGICILTTNHEAALDEAFRRRLSVRVRFQVPDADERKRLWRAMIPAAAPVAADLQLDKLAEVYSMSGGYIRNAVLRAAFLAADEESPITTLHLARAAQLEYEAMGKLA